MTLNLKIIFLIFIFAVNPAFAKISSEEFAQKISQKLMSVEEFKFIRETAEKMGLRVWLFGGTAAGYAHYVQQDALREQGDKRFQSDHFDYDFTNIYRSTQDLDIVANGTLEQIDELQRRLKQKYPHFLGGKAKWEVRSLRHARGRAGEIGYKEALLNDFDFLNQNTDSNSTGMVEITTANEPVVRDLRDWDAKECIFFKDVLNNRNHFYRSPKHFETARAKAGQNPEIFAVIRSLTKAFQYELTFTPEETAEMQDIINQFDPASIKDSEVRRRLIDIGKKLFLHSVNIEYAWNTLEKMNLRKKLMQFDSAELEDSLAWWMNKEPLRSFEVGTGQGPTAEELNIDIVAHEANTFLAFESITRAHTGDANFLYSRKGFTGENAVLGNGTYTQMGREGLRGTGLTVRLRTNPKARLGTDFIKVGNTIIFQNKKAFRVIPESIQMSILEYFKMLQIGKAFPKSERALLEKFKRKWNRKIQASPEDLEEIKAIIAKEMEDWRPNAREFPFILSEYFSSALATTPQAKQLIEKIMRSGSRAAYESLLALDSVAKNPRYIDWVKHALHTHPSLGKFFLNEPKVFNHPQGADVIDTIIKSEKVPAQQVYIALVYIQEMHHHPRFPVWLYNAVLAKGYWGKSNQLWSHIFSNQAVLNSPIWAKTVKLFIDKMGTEDSRYLNKELMESTVKAHPDWFEVIKHAVKSKGRSDTLSHLIFYNTTTPHWAELVDLMVDRGFDVSPLFVHPLKKIFEHPRWPQLIEKILTTYQVQFLNINDNPQYDFNMREFISNVLSTPKAGEHPSWLRWMTLAYNKSVAADPMHNYRLIQIQETPNLYETVEHVLKYMNRFDAYDKFHQTFFNNPMISANPRFKEAVGGKEVTAESLDRAMEAGFKITPRLSCPQLFNFGDQ